MMRFRVDEKQVLSEYVFRFLNSPICKSQVLGSAKRAVAQSSINQGDVAAIKVPLPGLDEQREVVGALSSLGDKGVQHQNMRALLQDMFRTLLHELMTAERRVDEMDLTELKALGIEVD